MGLVLGLTFNNFYISNLEKNIQWDKKKTNIYLRFVDDILIQRDYTEEI